jgi:mannose-6-phosphate isomerase-like protein (cupin superfamily)
MQSIISGVPSGCAEIRHYHNKSEQFFYIFSGVATIEVDGKIHQVSPSKGLHITAGQPHRLSNQHNEDLVFIIVSTPPSHGDRVEA